MKIHVYNVYADKTTVYEGSQQQLLQELLLAFPFLRSPNPNDNEDLSAILEELDSVGGLSVEVEDEDKPVYDEDDEPAEFVKVPPEREQEFAESWAHHQRSDSPEDNVMEVPKDREQEFMESWAHHQR